MIPHNPAHGKPGRDRKRRRTGTVKQRIFGKTGRSVSEIGLGTWQLGTKWGDPFNREEAFRILEAAEEAGITFIDTADVYNGGKSEETIGEYISAHPGKFYITTKCGRRAEGGPGRE